MQRGGAEVAPVRMRSMTVDDLPAVLEIEKVSFLAPWTRGMFEQTLSSPVARSLVAQEAGRVLGYVVFYCGGPEMHIMNIAVHPVARRRGLAFEVLSRVLAFARENDLEECFLEVRESNTPARGLYEKLGFGTVGRRKGYYSESGEDALVMRISL